MLHVTGPVVEHVTGIDAVQRDVVARDAEGDQLLHASPFHLDGDLAALLAAQALLDVAVLHLHAGDDRVVHHDDAVTRQHTHALAGAAVLYLPILVFPLINHTTCPL